MRKKADQVYIKWEDRNILDDLSLENKNGTYILEIPKDIKENELNLKKIKSYDVKIILALNDFKKIDFIKEYNIPFYWKYPITSYFELRSLLNLGVCYFLLGAPLYFDLKTIKTFKVPVRLVANLSCDNFIPRKNGIKGTYVRPEDVQYYEEYVDVLEFYSESIKQEETLLKIYKED